MTLATDHLAAIQGGARQDPRDSASGAAPSYHPSAQQPASYRRARRLDGRREAAATARPLSHPIQDFRGFRAGGGSPIKKTPPDKPAGDIWMVGGPVKRGRPWPAESMAQFRARFCEVIGCPRHHRRGRVSYRAMASRVSQPRCVPCKEDSRPHEDRSARGLGVPTRTQVLGPARVLLVTRQRENVGCCPRPGKCWCQSETYLDTDALHALRRWGARW